MEFGVDPLEKFNDENENEGEEEDSEEIIEQGDLDEILGLGNNDDQLQYVLPPHKKCSSHKLHNVSKHGTKNAMKDTQFGKIAHVLFGKIRGIWNAQSRSTKKADVIREKCGSLFVEQGETRWNSWYDGLNDFIKKLLQSEDRLGSVCRSLEFRPFTDIEIEFVKEYLLVMRPIALALDNLQGDVGLGHILPIVTEIFNEFEAMDELTYCEPLKNSLRKELEPRFKHLFYDEIHILAALSDPKFKDYWINDEDYKSYAIGVLTKNVAKMKPKENDGEPAAKVPKTTKTFGQFKPKVQTQQSVVELYLSNDDQEIGMLKRFPIIEKIYRKTNTILASSASVERMFSKGKLVFAFNRGNLKDENFEKQLLLQLNQTLVNSKE